MMDIVKRLRDVFLGNALKDIADQTQVYIKKRYEAADEIERLREALRKVDACLSEKEVGWYERIEDAQNKIFDALLERDN